MNKFRSVEALRAAAALLVVLFHIQTVLDIKIRFHPFEEMFGGGHRGVDLFFVLSGFIIMYTHYHDLGNPKRLSGYVYNRLARVYPAVWIVSAFAIAAYSLGFGSADKLNKLAPLPAIASLFLLPQSNVPLVNVTWTLTYEIFFYLLFAIAIFNARLGLSIMAIWQISAVVICAMNPRWGLGDYYFRAPSLDFGVGLLCAWGFRRLSSETMTARAALPILILGLFCFAYGMRLDNNPPWDSVLCVIGAAALIVAYVRLEQLQRVWVPEFLVFLGGASYAIYLVHFSIIQLLGTALRRLDVPNSDLLFFVYVPVAILAGLAFDAWIDKPIQRYLRRYRPALGSACSAESRARSRSNGLDNGQPRSGPARRTPFPGRERVEVRNEHAIDARSHRASSGET
jgi:exopolysaccharide production protein ExoZ